MTEVTPIPAPQSLLGRSLPWGNPFYRGPGFRELVLPQEHPALASGTPLRTVAEPLGGGSVPRERDRSGTQSYLRFSSPVSDFFLPWREMEKQMVRMRGQHEANPTKTQRRHRGLRTTEQPLTLTLMPTDDMAQGMELTPCPALLVSSLAAEAGGLRGTRQQGAQERPPQRTPLPTWGSPCSSSKGAGTLIKASQQLASCSPYSPQNPLLPTAPSPPSLQLLQLSASPCFVSSG